MDIWGFRGGAGISSRLRSNSPITAVVKGKMPAFREDN